MIVCSKHIVKNLTHCRQWCFEELQKPNTEENREHFTWGTIIIVIKIVIAKNYFLHATHHAQQFIYHINSRSQNPYELVIRFPLYR